MARTTASALLAALLTAAGARAQGVQPIAATPPGLAVPLPAAVASPPGLAVPLPAAQPAQGSMFPIASSAPSTGSQHVAYQPPMAAPGRQPAALEDETAQEYQIPLEPPGRERVFRLESESQLMERMRQEARGRRTIERIQFPDEPNFNNETYEGRKWPQFDRPIEPNYVCYEKLLFAQRNYERYGWDLGPITPIICIGGFLADFVTVPYNQFKDPFNWFEASSGYCLPGDPVPLLLYPPQLSVTGAIAEAGAVLAIVAIFP